MRKLVALLCAVVLMMLMAMPAMANPSIGVLTEELVSAEVLGETKTDGLWLVVEDADTTRYSNDAVKDVVTKVNDPETVITVKELVEELAPSLANQSKLDEYDFTSLSQNSSDECKSSWWSIGSSP